MNSEQTPINPTEREQARQTIDQSIAEQIEQQFGERIDALTDIHSEETAKLFYEIERKETELFQQACKNNPKWAEYFYPPGLLEQLDKYSQETPNALRQENNKAVEAKLKKGLWLSKIMQSCLGAAVGAVVMLLLYRVMAEVLF